MTWEEYERASVRIHTPDGTIEVRPSPVDCEGPYPKVGDASIYVITAYNPRGRAQSDDANRRAHGLLVAELAARSRTFFDAVGGDVSWEHTEHSVAVVGLLDEEALAIGRLFHQDAIFRWAPSGWSVLACSGNRSTVTGFTSDFDEEARSLQVAARTLGLERPMIALPDLDVHLRQTMAGVDAAEESKIQAAYDAVRDHVVTWRQRRQEHAAFLAQYGAATAKAKEDAEIEERQIADQLAASASEQARRAENAKKKRELATRKRELLDEGWPPEWTKASEAWKALGGTAEQAQAFTRAGWSPAVALEAAMALGAAHTLTVPPGDAERHLSFGDDLTTLTSGEWPPAPADALVSIKRIQSSGSMERWFVVGQGAATNLSVLTLDGSHWLSDTPERQTQYPSVHAALEDVPFCTWLREGDSLDLIVANDVLTPHEVAETMHVEQLTPLDIARDGTSVADLRTTDGVDEGDYEAVGEALPDQRWLALACQINGLVVIAVHMNGRLTPVLFDWANEAVEPLTEIAHYSWTSESGGAPISWDGGASIELLNPQTLSFRQWGDLETSVRIEAPPTTQSGWVHTLATWIETEVEALVPAALALEPLDPGGTLDAEQQAEWENRLAEFSADLSLDLDDDTSMALRQAFTDESSSHYSHAYVEVVTALREPLSRAGRQLSTALDAANAGEPIGEVLSGNWSFDE